MLAHLLLTVFLLASASVTNCFLTSNATPAPDLRPSRNSSKLSRHERATFDVGYSSKKGAREVLISENVSGSEHSPEYGDVKRSSAETEAVRLYDAYLRLLDDKPIRTQIITAGIISALGDVLAQILEAKIQNIPLLLNWTRLNSFLISGAVFVGPFMHFWYGFLWKFGTWLERKYGYSRRFQILAQNAADQTIGVALFFPAFFYTFEFAEATLGLRGKIPCFSYIVASYVVTFAAWISLVYFKGPDICFCFILSSYFCLLPF